MSEIEPQDIESRMANLESELFQARKVSKIAVIIAAVAFACAFIPGPVGPQGPVGPTGAAGEQGPAGRAANVTCRDVIVPQYIVPWSTTVTSGYYSTKVIRDITVSTTLVSYCSSLPW
jgi:hypothetical protein